MKKYIIPVITLLALGSISAAGQTYAHGKGMKNFTHVMISPEKHQEHLETRLSALVNQGKITADQKKLIEDKFKSLFEQKQQLKTDWKGKTHEEMKALHEKERAELEAWAKENGIDLKLIGHGKMKMRIK